MISSLTLLFAIGNIAIWGGMAPSLPGSTPGTNTRTYRVVGTKCFIAADTIVHMQGWFTALCIGPGTSVHINWAIDGEVKPAKDFVPSTLSFLYHVYYC